MRMVSCGNFSWMGKTSFINRLDHQTNPEQAFLLSCPLAFGRHAMQVTRQVSKGLAQQINRSAAPRVNLAMLLVSRANKITPSKRN